MGDLYLIEKQGLYYRPDSSGYTGIKAQAGRYSFDDAAQIVGPNGPDGPQDGMRAWHEDDAPEYSSRCPWDAKLSAERDAARADVERLREALGVAVEYMKGLLEDGCPKCGGDCSSANPSVAFCPARELANDLRIATEALSTKGGA